MELDLPYVMKYEIYTYYTKGFDLKFLSSKYNLEILDVIHIIGEVERTEQMRNERTKHYVYKLKRKDSSRQKDFFTSRCKHCRWKPCVGAPCCYKDKIDGGRNVY